MEKELRLQLNKDGKWEESESHDLGHALENNATSIVVELPSQVHGFTHFLEFVKPSGDVLSTLALTEDNSEEVHTITFVVSSELIDEEGRYAMQYVGRNNNKVVKSDIISLDIDPSVNAVISVPESSEDFVSWASEKIQYLLERIDGDEDTDFVTLAEMNQALAGKVDKVEGKGLSDENYSSDEKSKLSGIASGAQVNVLEDVKVNGTSLTKDGKAVNIDLSEYAKKVGELPHYTVNIGNQNVLQFLQAKEAIDRVIVINAEHGGAYLGYVGYHGNGYHFEFISMASLNNRRYFCNDINLTGTSVTFGDIFSSTYEQNYALESDMKTHAKSLEVSMNSSTYVLTFTLKDANGDTLSTQSVDLPSESAVVGGTYDNNNKRIVLLLQGGQTVNVPVSDLISGLVSTSDLSSAISTALANHYTKTEMDTALGLKANSADVYSKAAVDNALNEKQATLVSGANIKTVNGQSILGEGNIPVLPDIGLSIVDGQLCVTYEEE